MLALNEIPLMNAREISNGLWVSGQPTSEQLALIHAAGVRTLVNLCPAGECGWDEQREAERSGLVYSSIPIINGNDLNREAALQLHQTLANCAKPVLVHCGSSNRAGALFALRSFYVEGCDIEMALQQGRAAGLKELEPVVRQILSSMSK